MNQFLIEFARPSSCHIEGLWFLEVCAELWFDDAEREIAVRVTDLVSEVLGLKALLENGREGLTVSTVEEDNVLEVHSFRVASSRTF